MRIVPPEPGVNLYEDGFEEPDLLQRKRLGDALSELLNRIDDPLVVALDGRWGTGKTHFLKRWIGTHARRDGGDAATVVYFDAFAHDSLGDPLPALVSALEESVSRSGPDSPSPTRKEEIQAMKAAAFRFAKPLARAGLASLGGSIALSAIDELTRARNDDDANPSEGFWKAEQGRRSAMEEFRQAIESLAAPADGDAAGSTAVIVVDELDRCRPDYALEVLEVIKHFFTVPRLHFVLGVNLRALEGMVRARYGAGIDARAYLAKFIQVTLDLPDEFADEDQQKRAVLVYLDLLLGEMGIPQHVADPLREQVRIVSRANPVSLRDVETMVSSVSLASVEVLEKPMHVYLSEGEILVMVDLVVSRTVRPDLHPKFLHASVTTSELESYLGATEDELREESGGQRNPAHDPGIAWRYHTWRYLSRNVRFKEDDPDVPEGISYQFPYISSRSPREPWDIPMDVHRRWLDLFSFFRAT